MSKENNKKLSLKLSDFDGPLDLLTSLIKEHKMDIMNLNVSELTNQYLEFIYSFKNDFDIEEASEYLVMATYLTELKSKKIIPTNEANFESSEFEYERDLFVKRLIKYNKYKNSIEKLMKKRERRLLMHDKKSNDIADFSFGKVLYSKLPNYIDPNKLMEAFVKIIEKYKMKEFNKKNIIVQELSIEDIKLEFFDFFKNNNFNKISFSKYLSSIEEFRINMQFIVTFFVSILELAKYQKILLTQKDDEIFIEKGNDNIE